MEAIALIKSWMFIRHKIRAKMPNPMIIWNGMRVSRLVDSKRLSGGTLYTKDPNFGEKINVTIQLVC